MYPSSTYMPICSCCHTLKKKLDTNISSPGSGRIIYSPGSLGGDMSVHGFAPNSSNRTSPLKSNITHGRKLKSRVDSSQTLNCVLPLPVEPMTVVLLSELGRLIVIKANFF